MLMKPMAFLETLTPKCCDKCGQRIEEMADCYSNTCHHCNEHRYYPLSPVQPHTFKR